MRLDLVQDRDLRQVLTPFLSAGRVETQWLIREAGLMFVTNHVLAGATIGRRLGGHPVLAFAAGVASHFVMDACPHWGTAATGPAGQEEFLRVARRDGCAGLVALGAAATLSEPGMRRSVVFAMAGAALPDMDKPCLHFFGFYPFPDWFRRFHGWIQHESPRLLPWELAVAGGLAVAVVKGPSRLRGGRARR
jgi:hypothetical protein